MKGVGYGSTVPWLRCDVFTETEQLLSYSEVAEDGRPRRESLGKPQESLTKQLVWRERSK